MAITSNIDREIAAAKLSSCIHMLTTDVSDCTAVWDDPESLGYIKRAEKILIEFHEYLLDY